MSSFACFVKTSGDSAGATNALRFATREEADAYGIDLACRWTAVREIETREMPEPVNYRWTPERGAERIEVPSDAA